MAESAPMMLAPVQSRKEHRAAKRKEKRKRKRQALAQARECGLKNGGRSTPEEGLSDGDENDFAPEERLRLHEEWLERERIAQEEFRVKCEKEETARKKKEDEERLIKEEWEAQQRREQEEKEQKLQEKRDKEKEPAYSLTSHYRTFSLHSKDEAVQKMLDEAENQLEEGRPWMNPEAPVTEKTENFGTERDVANCPFFLKTGACRFGDRCSRKHTYPTTSPTLMIRSMFTTFGLEESCRDDYDIDAYLEHSEEDLQESFLEFYHDVLPEFKSVGKVIQFKVSCNHEPHLRGNVYIQFDTEEQCKDAFIRFSGRWYAGRQLHCEICPVTRWKNAICGLFDRRKCPKGKHCNFLHVFRNPGNEFWEADRDLHLSPDRSVRGSRRDGGHSERYGDRSWRRRHSPPGSERSHSRWEDDRRRSRSRERGGCLQERDERWSSRSRHSDRWKDRHLSSRDRLRSRSRDREKRHSSRGKEREHKYRDSRDKDEDARRESRKRSRSTSTERESRQEKSRDSSPKQPDKSSKHSRHKRSKKSKKKSKKHKKKNHLPEASASSGESDKESEMENCSVASPSGETNDTELTAKNGDVDVNIDTDSAPSEQLKTQIQTSQLETTM